MRCRTESSSASSRALKPATAHIAAARGQFAEEVKSQPRRGERDNGRRNRRRRTARAAGAVFPAVDSVAVQPGQRGVEAGHTHQKPKRRMPRRRKGRQRAAGGEEQAHEEFFGKEPRKRLNRKRSRPAARVYARKVGQRSGGQERIPLARQVGHPGQDDARGGAGGRNGKRRKNPAVAPVKVVPLAEPVACSRRRALRSLQACPRIQEPVAHVDRPNHQNQQYGNPQRKPHAGRPGKAKRPDGGYRRGIEAGQVPKQQPARGLDRLPDAEPARTCAVGSGK